MKKIQYWLYYTSLIKTLYNQQPHLWLPLGFARNPGAKPKNNSGVPDPGWFVVENNMKAKLPHKKYKNKIKYETHFNIETLAEDTTSTNCE